MNYISEVSSITKIHQKKLNTQVTHLFPTMFAKEKVKKGLIKEEDVPVSKPRLLYDDAFFFFHIFS